MPFIKIYKYFLFCISFFLLCFLSLKPLIVIELYKMCLKLQSVAFWGLKIIQNPYLRKYITSQCSKLSVCLSSIQSGMLVIMFLIPVVLVCLRRRFFDVTSVHLKEETQLVGFIACEDFEGGDLAFSHST